MSYQLAFWRQDRVGLDAAHTFRTLMDDTPVEGVLELAENVPADLAAALDSMGHTDRGTNIFSAGDDEGPALDVWFGRYIISITAYGIYDADLNPVILAAGDLGFPLYDPQVQERFDRGRPDI